MLIDLRATLNSEVVGGRPNYLSLRSERTLSTGGQSDNAIIQGDNRLALALLKERYLGKVRCAYIDPPYNNNERYRHYVDRRDDEAWLSEIVQCVELIKPLLRLDGSLWVSIDDRQVHYLKVALDKVFGRQNFVSTIIWEQRTTRENRKVFSNNHEYILVYAAELKEFATKRGLLKWDDKSLSRFKNPDNDPRGPWQSVSANVQDGHATRSQFYEVVAPNGRMHRPPKGRCWVYTEARMRVEIGRDNVWFGKNGDSVPRLKRFLKDSRSGLTPHTLWRADEVGTNDQAKKHLLGLLRSRSVFDTPKPEGLMRRILSIASDPKDLILDAYLGSGTTAAVAHKMGRRYIGIEKGNHVVSHCVDRLRRVVRGEQGGVSGEVGWTGGGAFSFYKLDCTDDRTKITNKTA
jgi:adenine-specific DNA-methyltransferase